jgi:hypothetical protein
MLDFKRNDARVVTSDNFAIAIAIVKARGFVFKIKLFAFFHYAVKNGCGVFYVGIPALE